MKLGHSAISGNFLDSIVTSDRYPAGPVVLRPDAIKGAPGRSGDLLSKVDYRLARNAIIRNFRNGRLSRLDVCDAHPELMRAANHVADTTSEICPICEEANVVLVSYAFGSGLDPGGHNIVTKAELVKFARRTKELTCYVVEVCPECAWNHLARSFKVSGRKKSA